MKFWALEAKGKTQADCKRTLRIKALQILQDGHTRFWKDNAKFQGIISLENRVPRTGSIWFKKTGDLMFTRTHAAWDPRQPFKTQPVPKRPQSF
jgi:hypothetical protein